MGFLPMIMYAAFLSSVVVLLGPVTITEGGQEQGMRPLVTKRDGHVSFSNVSVEAGLSAISGNFFSWGDVDADGHQDLLIDGKRLMRNKGPPDFRFEDITSSAMLQSRTNSGVFADIDNDGWLDLFCGGGYLSSDHPTVPDVLWRNTGGGRFEDVTEAYGGLSDTYPTAAGGWADLDRNGFVDLYMVNYENGTYQGYADHLWSNTDGRSFVNRSDMVHMNGTVPSYQGRGVSWGDFDNDGWQDAYISNYRIMRNYLFRNEKGRSFSESAEEEGVEGHASTHPVTRDGPYYGHSLGSSWGDLDNDGDLDLWVTNLAHKDPWRGPICDDSYLFENLLSEQGFGFRDRREGSGIEIKTIPGSLGGGDELMVSSSLADYDNDGDLDLFIPQIYGDVSYAYSLLYRNDGGLTFTEVGQEAGVRVWNTYGSAWCDFNEDGRVDLITGGGVWGQNASSADGYMVHLFRNDGASTTSENDWLEVSLEGRSSNRAAIGARVTAKVDTDGDGTFDRSVLREVQGGQGAHGQQDSMALHFGLGEVRGTVDLEVKWPLGRTVMSKDIVRNSVMHLVEPEEEVSISISIGRPSPVGEGVLAALNITNRCDQVLKDIELFVSMVMENGSIGVGTTLDGDLAPGEVAQLSVLIEGAAWEKGSILTAEVTRSFPPVTSGSHGELPFILPTNRPPVAILSGPERAYSGDTVTFSGALSYDQDGRVASYIFDAGDGSLEVVRDVPDINHIYIDEGSYLPSLSVTDDMGSLSEGPSFHRITIEHRTLERPTARIVRVSPESALLGDEVVFEGTESSQSGSSIASYSWVSSLDGPISDERSFSTRALSRGNHTISFTVTDSNGLSSEPDMAFVSIMEMGPPSLFIAIEYPSDGSVIKDDLKARGSAGPSDIIDRVEVRTDDGTWTRTSDHLLPGWNVIMDIRTLEAGSHRLEARAGGGPYLSPVVNVTFIVPEKGNGSDRSGDPDENIHPTDLAIVIIASMVIVTLLSLVLYLWSRERAGRKGGAGDHVVETAILLDEGHDGKRL